MKLYFFQFIFIVLIVKSTFAINPSTYIIDTFQNIEVENHIKKRYISVGLVMAHFSTKYNNQESGYGTSLFNLGGESLINLSLRRKLELSTGLYYQYGKAEYSFVNERLIFGELSLPFIVSVPFAVSEKKSFLLSPGFYLGSYINEMKQIKDDKLSTNNSWHELPTEYIDGYTSEKLIFDFYIGLGYREFNSKNGFFQFNLFTKYRLNKHWLNQDISKLIFGIKINYLLKF